MAPHSSVLAWRIPGTGSLVGCRPWGRTELDTTELTEQQQQQFSIDFNPGYATKSPNRPPEFEPHPSLPLLLVAVQFPLGNQDQLLQPYSK